jgi:amino acid transporter
LIGDVIANYAGPSVIFSFVIAGLATFLAGMSYAELGELKKYFIGHIIISQIFLKEHVYLVVVLHIFTFM